MLRDKTGVNPAWLRAVFKSGDRDVFSMKSNHETGKFEEEKNLGSQKIIIINQYLKVAISWTVYKKDRQPGISFQNVYCE